MKLSMLGVVGAFLVAGCAEVDSVDFDEEELGAAESELNGHGNHNGHGHGNNGNCNGDGNGNGNGNNPDFDVEFDDCIESIGVTLVPTAAARALTPSQYILVGEADPVTPLVVRTAHCEDISVDGSNAKEGSIVQIGAVIVPPDFTGDINNYTFWYYTDHKKLATKLNAAGVAATYVPNLEYDFDEGCGNQPDKLQVVVPNGYAAPKLKIKGTVVESQAPAGSFDANWWREASASGVKMATNVPVIDIGSANLTLTTAANNQLGQLIGGSSIGFPLLQQFNTFDTADMSVITQ